MTFKLGDLVRFKEDAINVLYCSDLWRNWARSNKYGMVTHVKGEFYCVVLWSRRSPSTSFHNAVYAYDLEKIRQEGK